MPLASHSNLPSFARLREQGHELVSLERQFLWLVGNSNCVAQIYVYPFSLASLKRGSESLAYIERYYSRFEDLRDAGLDALIITGANVARPHLACAIDITISRMPNERRNPGHTRRLPLGPCDQSGRGARLSDRRLRV